MSAERIREKIAEFQRAEPAELAEALALASERLGKLESLRRFVAECVIDTKDRAMWGRLVNADKARLDPANRALKTAIDDMFQPLIDDASSDYAAAMSVAKANEVNS